MKKRSRRIPGKKTQQRDEISAGAIVFTVRSKRVRFLLMEQNNAFYGRDTKEISYDIGPKGHVKRGESFVQTASREVMEETGLRLHIDTNFKEEEAYSFMQQDPKTRKRVKVNKKVVYFVAFAHEKDIKQIELSAEHLRYHVLPAGEAIDRVRFENQKQLLRDTEEYVKANYLLT